MALAHRNSFFEDSGHGHRGILLDRLIVRRGDTVVYEYEMEQLNHPVDCHHLEQGAFHLSTTSPECVLRVPVDIPLDGTHEIEVLAWADRAGDELAKLEISVGSDTDRSAGSRAIKDNIVDLYERLHGLEVTPESSEVQRAYGLFVDVWKRRIDSKNGDFYGWNEGVDCRWTSDEYYLEGIVDDAFVWRDDWDWGEGYGWDFDRINPHLDSIDWSDPHGVAETWTVVLAYMLMNYRYLYL